MPSAITQRSPSHARSLCYLAMEHLAAPICLTLAIATFAGCQPSVSSTPRQHTTLSDAHPTDTGVINDGRPQLPHVVTDGASEPVAKTSSGLRAKQDEEAQAARQQSEQVDKQMPVPATTKKRSRAPKSKDPIEITFDDLKLEMPLGTLFDSTMLTPRVEELDGQNVRLRGFIFAGGVFQTTGIKSFPFVMNTQCKFGPQGLAYCVIMVDLNDGVTADFTTYPITVEGEISVRPFNMQGFTWSVYHMHGKRVF